ncbi:MAG: radical SAM protein, partial [Clostridia bacterium]|nr:radical SAM protein [Clostridia bacterium]
MTLDAYRACRLCPRACGVDRTAGKTGVCRVGAELRVARAALHLWEEPCLVGENGSGTVFFAGCGLGCVYCQNREISRGEAGATVTVERLSEIFLELQSSGAANINLVTGTQFVPSILPALDLARANGLTLPVLWNTGGYETVDTLDALNGYVDIFLPDYKYAKGETATAYSHAPDYPIVALEAIKKMLTISGEPVFAPDGRLLRGTVVRLLLLPGHLLEAKT